MQDCCVLFSNLNISDYEHLSVTKTDESKSFVYEDRIVIAKFKIIFCDVISITSYPISLCFNLPIFIL